MKRVLAALCITGVGASLRIRSEPKDKLLPIGEGAYQNPEAVMQRTTSTNVACEEGQWHDCYKGDGDYMDHKKEKKQEKKEEKEASLVAVPPKDEEHLPIGEGAYQDPKAVMQRTTSTNVACEEGQWHDCYKSDGDYMDHKKPSKKSEEKKD